MADDDLLPPTPSPGPGLPAPATPLPPDLSADADESGRDPVTSKLRHLRELFTDFVQRSPDLVFQTDGRLRFTYVNDAWTTLLGYRPDELLGRPMCDFQPPDSVERDWEVLRAAGRGEEIRGHRSVRRHKDGHLVPVLLHVRPVRGADGELHGVRGAAVDISAQVAAEERLEATLRELESRVAERTAELAVARDRAEAADRAKANFLAVTSHELRNPLSNVLGFTALLLDEVSGPLNETQRRQVELLQDNARLLRRLAEDIADYLRLDGHRLRPQVEPVDLCAVGRRVAAGVGPRAMDAGLYLETRIPSGSIVAAADARRVEQVLHNLLDNAIKYTEAGRVDLRVARDGPQVITEVADTGPGIPAHQRDAIFEPFHRLPGRGRRADGVGLGLAISRGLARAMGGELTVSSAVGRGSRFTLRLPAWGDGSL